MGDTPALKAVEDASPSHSAIIEAKSVFDADEIAGRGSGIRDQLADAVRKGIKADILTLTPVDAGRAADVDVAFHIRANGHLGVYTESDGASENVKGLLRWYEIDWKITFRPPGAARPIEYDLASNPGSQLKYNSDPSDPDWAVYSVVLDAGFTDMSAQLIKGFGLDPGPAQTEFSFHEHNPNHTVVSARPSQYVPYGGGASNTELDWLNHWGNRGLPSTPSTPAPIGSGTLNLPAPVRGEFWLKPYLHTDTTEHWTQTDPTHWQRGDADGTTSTYEVAATQPAHTLSDMLIGEDGDVVVLLPKREFEVKLPSRDGASLYSRTVGSTTWLPEGVGHTSQPTTTTGPATQP